MATLPDNMIMPPSVEVAFSYNDSTIETVPLFLLMLLIRQTDPKADSQEEYQYLNISPDNLSPDNSDPETAHYISYLKQKVGWQLLSDYIVTSRDTKDHLQKIWVDPQHTVGSYSITIRVRPIPGMLYRYMRFNKDWLESLLRGGGLYLPSPSQFNDPFDCSLDDSMRLTFIECGMGSFSTKRDNVLMFSHYADHHRGFCLGVDSRELVQSMSNMNQRTRADVRPVWYFNRMPKLDLKTQPALCATCKHDIWKYEEEYRLFVADGAALKPAGSYLFDRNAIREVVFGCRASDECIATTKTLTADLSNCKHMKVCQIPNQFGVSCQGIHRL